MTKVFKPCQVMVLIGGNGSNLQALMDYAPGANYQIAGVISHRPDVYGLIRAEQGQIPHTVVDHTRYEDRFEFEKDLIQAIDEYRPDLIVLAGFMRILSGNFTLNYYHKILNIHPALLPKYKGLKTHQRVLEAKDPNHGASVHYVTRELDSGGIIAQARLSVHPQDTAETLQNRVHCAEHWLYPKVVNWYSQKRLTYDGLTVSFDDLPLPETGKVFDMDF